MVSTQLVVLNLLIAGLAAGVSVTSHSSTESTETLFSTSMASITEELENVFKFGLGHVLPQEKISDDQKDEDSSEEDGDDDDDPTVTLAIDMKPPKFEEQWSPPSTPQPTPGGFLMLRIIEAVRSKEHPDEITINDRRTFIPLSLKGVMTTRPPPSYNSIPSTTPNTPKKGSTEESDESLQGSDKKGAISASQNKSLMKLREDDDVDGDAEDDPADLQGAFLLYPGYNVHYPYPNEYPYPSKRAIKTHWRWW